MVVRICEIHPERWPIAVMMSAYARADSGKIAVQPRRLTERRLTESCAMWLVTRVDDVGCPATIQPPIIQPPIIQPPIIQIARYYRVSSCLRLVAMSGRSVLGRPMLGSYPKRQRCRVVLPDERVSTESGGHLRFGRPAVGSHGVDSSRHVDSSNSVDNSRLAHVCVDSTIIQNARGQYRGF